MLAADKLQLQSALKQQATALKEKEFSLHHNNLMTVGTQAAVLAGLDITLFVEFNPPPDAEWGDFVFVARLLKAIYYGLIVAAFCSNMSVVAHTTSLSVLGGSLALRGPDGSMMVATDALYAERPSVFYAFGVGLACTILSVMVCVWIFLRVEAATVCWLVTMLAARRMYANHKRVSFSLGFDESQTVDFRDIFEGPAAIFASHRPRRNNRLPPSRTLSGPARTRSTATSSEDEDDDDLESQPLASRSGPKNIKRRGAPSTLQSF